MKHKMKMWRVAAGYMTFADRVFDYTVFGVNKAEAKERWNQKLPWLGLIDIKPATKAEEEEYANDMGEFYEWTKERPLVWKPSSERYNA